MAVKVEITKVNAKMAVKWLLKRKPFEPGVAGTNRKVSVRMKAKWAHQMANGRWRLIHQGICFREDGTLEDGQHRLEALLEAEKIKPGVEIDMMVTYGMPEGSFPYIDIGLKRRPGDIFSSQGVQHGIQMGATSKLVFCYFSIPYTGSSAWIDPAGWNHAVMLETADSYPTITEAVERIKRGKFQGNISAITAAFAVAMEMRPEYEWEPFIYRLETGLGFGNLKGDPAYELREKLISLAATGHNGRSVEQMAICIKAMNKELQGEKVTGSLRQAKGDKFPRIIIEQAAEEAK